MNNLPTIKDLCELIKHVKGQIDDEYRAFEEDEEPGIQLTIGWNPENGSWSYQTGDNCYMGSAYHYPIWAVTGVYRDSNCRELAKELIAELDDQNYE